MAGTHSVGVSNRLALTIDASTLELATTPATVALERNEQWIIDGKHRFSLFSLTYNRFS
jgi:hypothetical protein